MCAQITTSSLRSRDNIHAKYTHSCTHTYRTSTGTKMAVAVHALRLNYTHKLCSEEYGHASQFVVSQASRMRHAMRILIENTYTPIFHHQAEVYN